MNIVKSAFLLSAAFLLFVRSSASAEDKDDYSPLKIGNEWIMDDVTNTSTETKSVLTVKITSTVDRDGKQYFVQHCTGALLSPQSWDVLVRKDEMGIYSITKEDNDGKEQTDIQLPFVVGKHWKRYFELNEGEETEIGIETIEVGGKTYEKCYRLRFETDDHSYRLDFWQAPNVGQIKCELSMVDYKDKSSLREFKPAKY